METLILPISAETVRLRLRQFALYDDYDAGVAARWLAREISRAAGPERIVTHELWKLDLVARFGAFRTMTLQDAGEAEVLIIAASETRSPEPVLCEWLEELRPWKANRPGRGLLVGLLGSAESDAEEISTVGELLALFAESMGMDYMWQPMGVYTVGDSAWVLPEVEWLISRE